LKWRDPEKKPKGIPCDCHVAPALKPAQAPRKDNFFPADSSLPLKRNGRCEIIQNCPGISFNTHVISNERRRNKPQGEEKTYKTSIEGMQGKTLKVSPCQPNAKAWRVVFKQYA